jgi:hypothetical protein
VPAWFSTWGPTTLCVALAILLALLGTALWHERGIRLLQALRAEHWTERARVYAETSRTVVRFRRWLVLGVLLLALPRTARGVEPGTVLRYLAVAWGSFVLFSYWIDSHWVRPATQGELTPHPLGQAVWISVVWWSSSWITLGFTALAPARYDAAGVAWALGLVVALTLGTGLGARLARNLGVLTPVPADLAQAISKQGRRFRLKRPAAAYVIQSPRVFAGTLFWSRWLVISSGALERLAHHEVVSLSTYQFRWLRLSWRTKAWMQVPSVAHAFLPIACVPAFPEAPWAGVWLGVLSSACLSYLFPSANSPWEGRSRRISPLAPDPIQSRYPLALERAYQANWQPLVDSEQSRSLYELRVEAGSPPDYPRPRAVSRRASDLGASLGFVIALLLGLGLRDWLQQFFAP